MQDRNPDQQSTDSPSGDTPAAAPHGGFGMAAAMAAGSGTPPDGGAPPEQKSEDTKTEQPADVQQGDATGEAAADTNAGDGETAATEPDSETADGAATPPPAVTDKGMEKQVGGGKSKENLKPAGKSSKSIEMIENAMKRGEEKMGNLSKAPLNRQKIQTEFYRDRFYRLIQIALFNAVIMAAIIITTIFYMFQTKPDNRFFATTIDGRILQLTPLDQQSMTPSQLYSWMVDASMETMSFGFHDYQRRLQNSTQYFTRDGWESFASMLQEMRIIETLEQRQMVLSMQPRSAPVLVQHGVVEGRYRWIVDIDFNITMQGAGISRSQPLHLRLTIERVPALENVAGVAIARWAPRPGTTPGAGR
jgi:intracellular multiplication protein IcmL